MSYAFSGQHETHKKKKKKITERIIITVIHSILFFNVSSDAGVLFPPVGILD